MESNVIPYLAMDVESRASERRPRVGVVTLAGDFNYGNKLQVFACVRLWEELGFEAEYLDHDVLRSPLDGAKAVAKRAMGMGDSRRPEELSTPGRLDAFVRFNGLIPTRRDARPGRRLADEYDLFSVGSDQVWNLSFEEPRTDVPALLVPYAALRRRQLERAWLEWFFPGFCRPEQRVALSPSLGTGDMCDRTERLLRRGTVGIRLSVREPRGAELVRAATGREALVVCDPNVAVPAEEWRALADGRCTPTDPRMLELGALSYQAIHILGGLGAFALVRLVVGCGDFVPSPWLRRATSFTDACSYEVYLVHQVLILGIFSVVSTGMLPAGVDVLVAVVWSLVVGRALHFLSASSRDARFETGGTALVGVWVASVFHGHASQHVS